MKLKLLGYTIFITITKNHPIDLSPVESYFSHSHNRMIPIREMGIDYLRNALLKELGMSDLRHLESEKVIKHLTDYEFTDNITLTLFNELKRKVEKSKK